MLLAVILELLGRVINSTGVTIAAAAALGAVISDALLTPGVGARVRQRHSARMTVGVPAAITFTVEPHFRRPFRHRRPVVVTTRSLGLEPARIVVPSLSAGQHATAEWLTVPSQRGHWPKASTMTFESVSPLGGWVRRTSSPMRNQGSASFWVHPAPAPPLQLPESGGGDVEGMIGSARVGFGMDFFGIREWRSGDAASTIHWRASARRGQLVVLERERPGRAALVVAVDGIVAVGTWEHGLARAAATAVRAARGGQAVVLVAESAVATVTRPRDVLDWFAAVRPASGPAPTAVRQAFQRAGAGAAVVWVGALAPSPQFLRQARSAGAAAIVATGGST